MTTYVEVARKLRIPSVKQTREFAEYVTGAHSWYKHLSAHPPSPFVFYLDPHSGRAMVHISDDEVAFLDNTDESKKFHYTWQTTKAYRRRFGFWNYEAPYGRSFRFQSAEGIVDTAGSGLRILDSEGDWAEVPAILAKAGTALVSSLMWTYPSRRTPGFELRESEIRNSFGFDSARGKRDPDRNRYYEKLKRGLPTDVVEALGQLQALWNEDNFQREKTETHRARDEMLDQVYESDRGWDKATNEIWSALYGQAEAAWNKTESRRKERDLMALFIAGIDRERERQICGMVDAMNLFVASLHHQVKRSH